MSRCLYIEGASGIAGDMTVAALLELGGNREKLLKALSTLPMHDEFECQIGQGKSYGIAGGVFKVFCHGGDHELKHYHHEHDDDLHHDHHHHDDHYCEHHHHDHHHEHRNLAEIKHIISHAELTDRARSLAGKIFQIVAEAEAQAHGCSVEEVHFHEVGAVDSIVVIVAAAVLIDDLDITSCVVENLTEGRGFVKCQHGELPIPVPAVLNMAIQHDIPFRQIDVQGEMITPTGMAIAAALRTQDKLPEKYLVKKVGIGVGKRDFGRANVLRLMLIEAVENSQDQVWVMESNIDDTSGELLGCTMEKLLANGAWDVHFTPCFMKKNRPAYLLRVIAPAAALPTLERIIFAESSTIGIRRYPVERSCMSREAVSVKTIYGTVRAKKCCWQDIVRIYPEYESVKALAAEQNVPVKTVFDAALAGVAE